MTDDDRPTIRLTPTECLAETPAGWAPAAAEKTVIPRHRDIAALSELAEGLAPKNGEGRNGVGIGA